MRRVLHLKNVTQCAMLEEVSVFLVLANKVDRLIDALEEFVYAMSRSRPSLPATLT